MIKIYYTQWCDGHIDFASKIIKITQLPRHTDNEWCVIFLNKHGDEQQWYLYSYNKWDGIQVDGILHKCMDEDWTAWVAKYNHNIEVEDVLEKL